MTTVVNGPLKESLLLKRYVPGASTIVVFDDIEETAACNWLSVETLTMIPDGGGSGGAGRAGAAAEGTASARMAKRAEPRLLKAINAVERLLFKMIGFQWQWLCQGDPPSPLAPQDFCSGVPYNSRRC